MLIQIVIRRNQMSKAPCKDCPNKGCGYYHSQCEQYIEFQKECEEARKARRTMSDYLSYKSECVKVRKRRKLNETAN